MDSWKEEFLIQALPNDPDNFPFIVLGNKIDKVTSNEDERKVPLTKALDFCKRDHAKPIDHFETSAKSDKNVIEAFRAIALLALKAGQQNDDYMPDLNVVLPPSQEKAGGGCC